MKPKIIISNIKQANTSVEIDEEKPVDMVIKQLKYLLTSGQLNPGDRLLSERKLAEKFDVSRTHIREAIKKLEFYGILKTLPQSGTFVSGLETSTLENLISDALQVECYDFYSLAESRLILESNIVQLACQRRTDNDLILIEEKMNLYEEKIQTGTPAVEEDLNFHRQIADASKNHVLKSMMLIITPDIMTNYRKYKTCCEKSQRSVAAIEHRLILEYIRNQDEESAVNMIRQHLKGVMEYARTQIITEKSKQAKVS